MKEPDPAMWCPECGCPKMMTESNAILCPHGHGKVLSNSEITKTKLKYAERDRQRWHWLQQFPAVDPPYTRRRGFINGVQHVMTSLEGRKTSLLHWLEVPLEGYVVAQWHGEARYFRPLKGKSS